MHAASRANRGGWVVGRSSRSHDTREVVLLAGASGTQETKDGMRHNTNTKPRPFGCCTHTYDMHVCSYGLQTPPRARRARPAAGESKFFGGIPLPLKLSGLLNQVCGWLCGLTKSVVGDVHDVVAFEAQACKSGTSFTGEA